MAIRNIIDIKMKPEFLQKPRIVYKLENKEFEVMVYEMPERIQYVFLYSINTVLVDFGVRKNELYIITSVDYLKLNFKQREAVLANVLDILEYYKGMPQSEVVLYEIRSAIKARIMYLSQRERTPGDFGQEE